jgi:diadenylate cyclase
MTPLAAWADLGGAWNWAIAIADVLLVSYLIYSVLRLIKGTNTVPVLVGLGVITVLFFASKWLGLTTFHWVLGQFLSYSLIFGVIVIFQADIRRGLARLGKGWSVFQDSSGEASRIEEVVTACQKLALRREGALIVLERSADLAEVAATGVRLDAEVSEELLLAIFRSGAPMHDGAVVISGGRIAAARCVLPLTKNPDIGRDLGTRHRSAIGLSEEVDAVVVVVSEERGSISLAIDGQLHRDLDVEVIRKYLLRLFAPPLRRKHDALPGRAA